MDEGAGTGQGADQDGDWGCGGAHMEICGCVVMMEVIYINMLLMLMLMLMPTHVQRSSAPCITHAAVIRYMYTVLTCLIALNSSAPALTLPFVLPRTHSCPPSHYPPISLSRYLPIPLSSLPGLDPSLLGLEILKAAFPLQCFKQQIY